MNVRNHIHLTGNLGADPKTLTLESGLRATEFSLATNEYFRDKEGNRQTRTEWHRVKAYGKLAELFDQYLERGSQVSIVGSMRYRRWTDQYEQPRIAAEVIAQEFTFLSGGKRAATEDSELAETLVGGEPTQGDLSTKTLKRRTKKSPAATAALPA